MQHLTPAEIERMREILAQHDAQGEQEFDLNKPKVEPYRHQEFPRIVYHPTKGTHRKVHNQAELDKALSAGHSIEAPTPEDADSYVPESRLSAAEQAEIRALDKRAKLATKKENS